MENTKLLKHVIIRGNNKMILVGLYLNENDNSHFFIQSTRTIIDRKKREIVPTRNIYSVETFAVLSQTFSKFLNDGEISNKILNIELSKIAKFTGKSNF